MPDGIEKDGDSDDEYAADGQAKVKPAQLPSDGTKIWTMTEKNRFERCLMLYGYSSWEKMLPQFSRRTVEDLEAIGKLVVTFCLNTGQIDNETASEMRRMIGAEPMSVPVVEEGVEIHGVELLELQPIPYEGATERQIVEYRSYLLDTTPEYHEHVEKKAKNLLTRIQMLHHVRTKIQPHAGQAIPSVLGNAPASWWGEDEDRDLMRGILKHGYAQYLAIRNDSELCFAERKYSDEVVVEESVVVEGERKISGDDTVDEGRSGVDTPLEIVDTPAEIVDTPLEIVDTPLETVDPPLEIVETPKSLEEGDDVTPMDQGEAAFGNDVEAMSRPSSPLSSVGVSPLRVVDILDGVAVWPGASELGVRVRRVLAAFLRQIATDTRRRIKKEAMDEKVQERKDRNRNLTKRERTEFRRVLLSFGVEKDGEKNVWDRFRELSGIKRADDIMDEHYEKTNAMIKECIELSEANKAVGGSGDRDEAGTAIRVESGSDSISLDVAKRVLKRVEKMRALREEILVHEKFDKRIDGLKRHNRSGLPLWWTDEHDKEFLKGVGKWGITRTDAMVDDDTLPFKVLQEGWLAEQLAVNPDFAPKGDDRFWMRDTIATRRFEVLCDAVMDVAPVPAPKRVRLKRGKAAVSEDDEEEFFGGEVVSPPKRRKRSSVGRYSSKDVVDDGSSGCETELSIGRVLQRLSKEKKKVEKMLVSPPDLDGELYRELRAEFMSKEVVEEVKKASIMEGLDLEANDDDVFYALDLASAEARRVVREMGEVLGGV